jgi:hypothetical protein
LRDIPKREVLSDEEEHLGWIVNFLLDLLALLKVSCEFLLLLGSNGFRSGEEVLLK